MQHIDQKEVDRAYDALNKANFRVSQAAEKIKSCQQELNRLEQTLREHRARAQSSNSGQEYSCNDSTSSQRIRHLENVVSGARNQLQNAEQAHQQERSAQQAAQARVKELLSKIDSALKVVQGNIQKLRATTGKSAQRLAGMLRTEEQEQSKLQQMRSSLTGVLQTSQRPEMAGPSRGSSGLEGIVSSSGGGGTVAGSGPAVRRTTYVREEVYIRRTTSYTVERQMAADPYTYPHPDNHTPLYLREPWRARDLFQPVYQRTLHRLGHYW